MILWDHLVVNLWEEESKCEVSHGDSQVWGVSLEGLFKSEISLEDCKGCLEPKVQEGGLEP